MNKLISISEVCEITGLKKSSIYQRISEGTFAAPIKLGRASRWEMNFVNAWVENAIANGKV